MKLHLGSGRWAGTKKRHEGHAGDCARSLIDVSSDALFVLTTDGRITDVNQAAVSVTGVSREQLLGGNLADYIADPEQILALYREVMEKGAMSGCLLGIRHRSGKITGMICNANTGHDDRGAVEEIFLSARDVAGQPQADQTRRSIEDKFVEAQRLAQVGYWDQDMDAGTAVWSEETYRIFGLSPQEHGVTWDQLALLIHPDDREKAMHAIHEALQGGAGYDIEFRVIRPDGEERFIHSQSDVARDPSGHPLRMFGTVSDVTESKQAEVKLRNSEARYRALYWDNPAMLFTLDPQGIVLAVNPAGVTQLGYSVDELEGQSILKVFHPDDREDVARQLQTCLRHPNQIQHWQYRKVRKNGDMLWVDELARPIRDLTGAMNVLVVCQDVTERKRAEAEISMLTATLEQRVQDRTRELAESEKRFRTIYDTAPVSIWQEDWTEVIASLDGLRAQGVADFEAYFREHPDFVARALQSVKVVDVNRWTLAMFGATSKEPLLASLDALFATPDTLPGFVGELLALAQGQPTYCAEMTLNTVDGGTILCFLAMSFPAPGSGGGTVLVSVIDISERKRAEEALRHLEENSRLLFDTTQQGVIFRDGEGQIVSMNPAAIRILGKTQEEMAGRILMDLEHDTLREDGLPLPWAEHPCMVAMATGREVKSAVLGVYNPRERTYRWIELRAVPLFRAGTNTPHQVYTIFDDITERRITERHIRLQTAVLTGINRIFRETLPHVTDDQVAAIFLDVIRDLTGSPIGFAEEAGETSNGTRITLERSLQAHGDLSREDALALFRSPDSAALRHAFTTGRSQIINALRPDQPDNHAIRRFLGVPLFEAGKVVGFIGLANKTSDYTDDDRRAVEAIAPAFVEVLKRKRSEQSVLDLNAQLAGRALALERANKELEAFSYSASHDLRAPLRTLEGFSRTLIEGYEDKLDEEGKDCLHRIHGASERMSHLIDDMMHLAQVSRSELHRVPVNLSALARSVAGGLRMAEPKQRIEFVIEPDLIANGDPHLLQIVMENLFSNACKFSGSRPVARIEFGRTTRGGHPAYFVRDNGVGFDMRYAHKLFGAFQRLHTVSEFPGTGIGLATVQRVIHRHGGSVAAEGQLDHGATFYFTLPD